MSKETKPEVLDNDITVYNCDLAEVDLTLLESGDAICNDFVVSQEGQSTDKPTLTRRQPWFSKQKKPFFVCHKKICPHCHFGSLGIRSVAKFETTNSE